MQFKKITFSSASLNKN